MEWAVLLRGRSGSIFGPETRVFSARFACIFGAQFSSILATPPAGNTFARKFVSDSRRVMQTSRPGTRRRLRHVFMCNCVLGRQAAELLSAFIFCPVVLSPWNALGMEAFFNKRLLALCGCGKDVHKKKARPSSRLLFIRQKADLGSFPSQFVYSPGLCTKGREKRRRCVWHFLFAQCTVVPYRVVHSPVK